MTYPFFVKKGGRIYEVGETFEGSEAKVRQLVARGLATPMAEEPSGVPDLASLTVAELREMCETRGIDAPKRATKARLIELLEG